MKVLSFEAFTILAIGYVVGLSTISGLVFAEVRRHFINGKATWKDVVWTICACANILFCSVSAVTALIMFVIGDKGWDRADFWPRAVVYVVGISLGAGFVAFAVCLARRFDIKRR